MSTRSVLILAAAAGAAVLGGLSATNAGAQQQVSRSGGANAQLPSTLKSLVGEWEGTIQTRRADDWVSGSIVSVSNRLEDDGKTLSSVFDGFAFGKQVQGAAMWKPTAAGVDHSVYSSMLGRVMTCSASPSETAEGMVMAGECRSGEMSQRMEQVVTVVGPDRYTIDYFSVTESGLRSRVMSMDMSRMQQGRKSDAYALFDNAGLMRSVRSSMPGSSPTATVGVDTDK